ncbi:hypothetical protein [Halarcobacter ebronensis]|uniref:Uncharacterized protein n=1 Tax=Halarcobacter ebronensis TaxID=1462615 RepID=A0A4Q1ALJ2_9BACT|nr:hypothetical protein [Halarcobacter ebronensis]QKF82044.1 hypothetical protein AEBR_1561 [Halarcobacter ebronensis]RXK04122.1 hypothetical protein CRV07_11895 [Halarcobacter ebronensis]
MDVFLSCGDEVVIVTTLPAKKFIKNVCYENEIVTVKEHKYKGKGEICKDFEVKDYPLSSIIGVGKALF